MKSTFIRPRKNPHCFTLSNMRLFQLVVHRGVVRVWSTIFAVTPHVEELYPAQGGNKCNTFFDASGALGD
eukprot:1766433-Amphidinium_carterae.1